MSEVTLERLRDLRRRAADLLRFVGTDLRPFLHELDKETFRRKPESPSIDGDVNVTTTCSCLMALALTNAFGKFYEVEREAKDARAKAQSIFTRLIEAPWMSSGLTANNAFSSTLVLRTFGFLKEQSYLDVASVKKKTWELHLGIVESAVTDLGRYIASRHDNSARFLHSSLSDKTRELLKRPAPRDPELEKYRKDLTAGIGLDMRRLIQSGWIYSKSNFPLIKEGTLKELETWPTGYALARLNQKLFIEQFPTYFLPPSDLTIPEIANKMANDPKNFAINEYSASATVLYWFVDGLLRGETSLRGDDWEKLCSWATKEFNRERSLVLAEHAAMMDPVAMAMAACLCAKLRRVTSKAALGADKAHREMLPSMVELEHSIQELFKKQTNGIWPKYFPLFHYQEAGSNFCFTFELLEAVLCEFGGAENTLLDQISFVKGLEDSVAWCERNRLKCSQGADEYTGWNSGGDIESLKKERPESWATAVVHMFLWELTDVLSQRIQKRVLQKYNARPPKKSVEEMMEAIRKDPKWREKNFGESLSKLQDIQLFIDSQHHCGLITVLKDELVNANFGKSESQIRRETAKGPLSALLFGPPGTSKTRVTRAIAEDLGWPFVEINPSDFVKGNFANVYLQADEIFRDLQDLAAVVVLFDEMDALTQRRARGDSQSGTGHLDTATQFLTTSMLPKLTALHDKAGVVFLMATNFQENFDPAIKRAGRFDLHLCMGPPILEDKITKIDCFFDLPILQPQKEKAQRVIREYLAGKQRHQNILTLFTYGDFRSLLKRIGSESNLGDQLEALRQKGFLDLVEAYSETVGLKYTDFLKLRKGDATLEEIDKMKPEEFETLFESAGIKTTSMGQYLQDRRLSKRQF